MIHLVQKNKYETMGGLLSRMRDEGILDETEKATYAGRLDPLASGLCLVLSGEDRFRKDEYLGKDKVYEIKVLLGISTDTGDVLGSVKEVSLNSPLDISEEKKENIKNMFTGTYSQNFPQYSSRPVDGKPMWFWAKQGVVKKQEKQVTVHSINLGEISEISLQEVYRSAENACSRVLGDFRQEEILEKWNEVLGKYKDKKCAVLSMKVHCSSGTYMRALAESIGRDVFGFPALAYSIIRIKIGTYET